MTARNTLAGLGSRPFEVVSETAGFEPPDIIVQYDASDPDNVTGANWPEVVKLPLTWWPYERGKVRDAVQFLQRAVKQMTGRTLNVRSSADLSHGIVFTTLAGATPDIRLDPRVRLALARRGTSPYEANEAYYVRTEPDRILLVANTNNGLINAAAELAESVGYHVLGMGPNWVEVPDHSRSLVFDTELSGHPGYYLRALSAMSGQEFGRGTIYNRTLSDPADEPVEVSHQRWRVGARLAGNSMPRIPGHAFQAYHQQLADHIRDTGDPAGFLRPTQVGTNAARQATRPTAVGQIWVVSDGPQAPARAEVHVSVQPDSKVKTYEWKLQDSGVTGTGGFAYAVLDLSVPSVRSIILEGVKKQTETAFKDNPDGVVLMAIEPEDGGVTDEVFRQHTRNPSWYTDYLAQEGLPFGGRYALHGSYGIDQPYELWDPGSPTDPPTQSDAKYAFAHWMLREYDRWIDSLPKEQRSTRTGASKTAQIRAAFFSYNYHDVPPQFNIRDRRTVVMIAGYAKHRRLGKWTRFRTQLDVARALREWLTEPAADYRYLSIATAWDLETTQLPARFDFSAKAISDNLSEYYDAGVRAITAETDFNFGKNGLGYYLTARKLWDPAMSAEELDDVRDQWLRRAFGSAWQTMKRYYDFMLLPNYPVNSTSSWGHAVALLSEADRQIDPAAEPAVQRRIDDLKQYWYFYFLYDTGKMTATAPEPRTLVWKGQMSYMNALFALMGKLYGQYDPAAVAGPIAAGPAHFTAAETAVWWEQVRARWPEVTVSRFEDATLADGTAAAAIDLNDLTLVDEFVWPGTYGQFYFNRGQRGGGSFLTTATGSRQPIGFTLWWPDTYPPMTVYYGLERWDAGRRCWERVLDPASTSSPSYTVGRSHVVRVERPAPRAGVYRFTVGVAGGDLARLAPLTYDVGTSKSTGRSAHTYPDLALSLAQNAPLFFYLPKCTRSLDLDVWHSNGTRTLRIYTELLSKNAKAAFRDIDISVSGTRRIPLLAGEAGTVARILAPATSFEFPYLHSVPRLWAMSPAELLVPRAIATADGLTPGR